MGGVKPALSGLKICLLMSRVDIAGSMRIFPVKTAAVTEDIYILIHSIADTIQQFLSISNHASVF